MWCSKAGPKHPQKGVKPPNTPKYESGYLRCILGLCSNYSDPSSSRARAFRIGGGWRGCAREHGGAARHGRPPGQGATAQGASPSPAGRRATAQRARSAGGGACPPEGGPHGAREVHGTCTECTKLRRTPREVWVATHPRGGLDTWSGLVI